MASSRYAWYSHSLLLFRNWAARVGFYGWLRLLSCQRMNSIVSNNISFVIMGSGHVIYYLVILPFVILIDRSCVMRLHGILACCSQPYFALKVPLSSFYSPGRHGLI